MRDTYSNEKKSHNVFISEHVEKMYKGQDETFVGKYIDENGEEFDWCMIADGHGSDFCIDILRNIDKQYLNDIISKPNPINVLSEYINAEFKNKRYNYTSGSTACLVKCHANYIEVINCGDSQAAIFKNNELVLITEEHNWKNKSEKERLQNLYKNILFKPSIDIKIVGEHDLMGVYSEYIDYPDRTYIACSQALGHNGITGCSPSTSTVYFNETDRIKVIIGSDGLWDMILKDNITEMTSLSNMKGNDILQLALKRWLQPWNMFKEDNPTDITIASYKKEQCDDIGIIVMDILPIV
jgi:serine/threonine protein phosphatase PrpC